MPTGNRSTPSEEEIMDLKIKILEGKREYLCKFLNPETHFPYLRSVFILSQEDQERIQNQDTSKAKANKFLDILTSKGPSAYEHLVYSLKKDKTQMFLVEKLNKEFESKRSLLMGDSKPQRVQLSVDVNQLPKPPKQCQKEKINNQEARLNSEAFNKNFKSLRNGLREVTPREGNDRLTDMCNATSLSLQKQELEKYNSIAKNNDTNSEKLVRLEELMRKPDASNA